MATNNIQTTNSFETALAKAAECKKDIQTSFKEQEKTNFEQYYECKMRENKRICEILDKRRKNRTDSEKEELKKFKSEIRAAYNDVAKFADAQRTGNFDKYKKMLNTILRIFRETDSIGNDAFRQLANEIGLSLSYHPVVQLSDDAIKTYTEIFDSASAIRGKVQQSNDEINDKIFETELPSNVKFDKAANPTGMKIGDFRKLVDMKAKLSMANSKNAKTKVDEKIEKAAADKQFEAARAEFVRDQLTKLT